MVLFLLLHMKRVTCERVNRYILPMNLSSGFVVIPFVLRSSLSKVSFIQLVAVSFDC